MKKTKKRSILLTAKLEGISRKIFNQSYRKILKKHIGNNPGVYALYKKENLYYVGQAQKLVSRIKGHLSNKHAHNWDNFSVYIAKNRKYVPDLEAAVIAIADPKGNKRKPQLAKLKKATKLRKLIQKDMKEDIQKIMGPDRKTKSKRNKRKFLRQNNRRSPSLINPFGVNKPLKVRYNGQEYRAMLLKSGKVLYNGKKYNSPTGATKAVGSWASGLAFWEIQDHQNRWIKLRDIKKKKSKIKVVRANQNSRLNKVNERKSKTKNQKFSLKGLFSENKTLRGEHKKNIYFADLLTSGKVLYQGKEYSLSGAGKVVRGLETNGWTFWQIQDHKNKWVILDELRKKPFKKVA